MAYIKEYWEEKEKRAKQALEHTKSMEKMYAEDIVLAINNTKIYGTHFNCKKEVADKIAEITVEDLDTVSAAKKYSNSENTAVLNFASFKNPGGMFIKGSKAQEECLCHSSFLYTVLREYIQKYYAWNRNNLNKSLYYNRGLFTPKVIFEDADQKFNCSVITCAAPNKSAAQRYCNVSDATNKEALRSRIKFVLDIAKENGVNTLIAGAYGCGVFGQNPTEVAEIFKEYLTTTYKCFDKVVFAIPSGKTGNLEVFQKVFGVM